jgi:hypothetical protein
MLKDLEELKKEIEISPVPFPDATICQTEDGDFIIISNKPIRMDKRFSIVNPDEVYLPVIGYIPVKDRAILVQVNRQTQYTKEGMMAPEMIGISLRTGNGDLVNKSHRKQRYFIVKAGSQFSSEHDGIGRGDEVILVSHLDGLPSFPTIEDPSGVVLNECISLHYTEIVGYIKRINHKQ